MTDKMKHNILGLTTKEALAKLHNDVQEMLEKFHASQNFRWQYIKDSLHHSNNHSLLCWTSAVVLFVNGFLLLAVSTFYDEPLYGNLWLQGIIIIVLVICNLIAVIWDTKLRYGEITNRVLEILNYVKQSESICRWHPENYPHLCTPYSPCITLQWTYRDGNLVNLPWALLVAGDTILIRPGQPAPAYCIPFNEKNCPELLGGEVYSPPPTATAHDTFTTPAARTPLENKHYKLMETPFLKNLRAALDESTSRPVTFHNRQRHILMIACIEQLALPVVLACILCINTLRYVYVTSWVGAGSWVEMLVLAPVSLTLPLLPLIFPVAWICLYSYGTARLTALLHSTSSLKNVEDPFDDTDLGEKKPPVLDLTWKQVKPLFFNILFGHQHDLSRSANILHVLGSVTALCCVDKKGILSWPNPTAEKVFFLRNAQDISPALSETSLIDQHSDVVGLGLGDVTDVSTSDICNTQHDRQLQQQRNHHQHSHHHHFHHHSNPTTNLCQPRDMNSQMTVAEVLDLTHDHSCPFRLEFDDPSWKQFLPSLKPLGLAILLNTCNMATQDHYTQFCSHVTCEALYNEDLVPVTNRRCLCELAKQIGFADSAQHIFTLEQQLSTFRHVQPETVRRDIKFARSLALATKLKFPFPHMVAVVVKERANRGAMQLFSQGTADIVLDACVEYWNGKELCTLSPLDRKKVQDFYQRTSLTAYCTAFAYRPLSHSVGNNLSKVYMELPADSAHLYIPNRSPTPLTWSSGILGHFQSTDSLLGSEQHDNEVTDIDGCFQIQCNQVFVGMVTMQYQAQIDMVQLIEQLERACVRFVHFSKENELRSRVFSEKMGLESGWNCHISLLSERNSATAESVKVIPTPTKQQLSMNRDDLLEPLLNSNNSGTLSSSRQISMSAPSAINLDPPPDKGRAEQEARQGDKVDDEVNVTISVADINDGWQSLSCLTDSTEQSAPVNFDMSNRAKLPRGIDKIRPHLELVDNVPLLVSLFTDCTPSTTREMITIMQDYGEVVCVLGSSANADNIGLFLKANASIAVQPQFPQVCQKISVYKETRPDCGPSPVKISQQLNSLPCSISLLREDCGSIFHLIMEARHFMLCAWNCVQYWACCIVTLSAVQLAAALMLLPPLFTTGQVLWLTALIIPMLSLSLVGVPTDPQVMQRATGKNHCAMNADLAMFVLWCYGSKFLLTIFITPLVFAASLSTLCSQIVSKLSDDDHSQCGLIYPAPDTSHSWGGWTRYPFALSSAQQSAALLLVVHYITVSMSFVHREYLTWRRGPHINHMWLTVAFITYGTEERNHAVVAAVGCEVGSSTQRGTRTCVFMVIWCWESLSDNPVAPWRYIFCIIGLRLSLQICYTFVVLWWERQELEQPPSIFDLPWPLVVAVIVSPVLVFCINEFVKWQEIKANVRYQKRARLEFGTKLGMNSPF